MEHRTAYQDPSMTYNLMSIDALPYYLVGIDTKLGIIDKWFILHLLQKY